MNRGAVVASRTIDTIIAIPGKVLRFPGMVVRNINSSVFHFWKDFRALRAEVNREKKIGLDRIKRAVKLVEEARQEKAEVLKQATAEANQNIRDSKDLVNKIRASVNRRVKLATERMADKKAIQRMEKEAADITESIAAYEHRIEELEAQLVYAQGRLYDVPVSVVVEEDPAFEPFAEVRQNLFAAQAKAAKVEVEAGEVEGVASLLAAKGEAPSPEFHAASSEVADAPEEPVPAGVPLKDDGDDTKL